LRFAVSNLIPKAHTHARNAVLETRKSNPVAASEEHDLAAGEFATAAQSSSDQEVSYIRPSLEGIGYRVLTAIGYRLSERCSYSNTTTRRWPRS
jgi:hypothetical protein